MAQEEPNRLVEWLLLLRKQAPVVRRHLEQWLKAVRQEPVLIWQTPAVRYGVYGLGGLLLLLATTRFSAFIASPPSSEARPEATTADFHVVCSDPTCGHHFVIHRKFGYRQFPVLCSRCDRKTGARARLCASQTCRGRWVAPAKRDKRMYCPQCGEPFD